MPEDPAQPIDRRRALRFPMREPVEYRLVLSKRFSIAGKGETLNIGSGGILLSTQHLLPIGGLVELEMEWPARLGDALALKLVAAGRVLRSDPHRAALRLEKHQFQMRGQEAPPAGGE